MAGKRSRLPTRIGQSSNTYTDGSDYSDNSDYNDNEKILLSKVKRQRKDDLDSEAEAVFDVASDDDGEGSTDGSDIALSDVEGDDAEDDLPNVKAWGKDKRSYYSADYVDQDFGGHAGKDALFADFEEEEAQNLQLQLAKQLEDEDFLLEVVTKKATDKKVRRSAKVNEVVLTNTSNLTKRQQIQLLEQESPEFFNLIDDFKEKMVLVTGTLLPAKDLFGEGQHRSVEILQFVEIYQNLLLNYCTNITMYLLLKSQGVKLQSHPIIKRLLEYRQLIEKMNPVYEKNIADNKKLLQLIQTANNDEVKKVKKPKNNKRKVSKIVGVSKETKAAFTAFEKEIEIKDDQTVDEDIPEVEVEQGERRAITYQIKKNKGLMPTRKKEQRNPRVKHRNKFRKAQIRRKGAIREVRTEVNRYGGEISGIKSSVTKSIKIK